jgi:hypothetical protein
MVYQYTDYSGYGDESNLDTLKRRAKYASMFAGAASPGDAIGNMLSDRLNEATGNINQAVTAVSDPYEEMQRRMAGIQQQPATQVAGATQMPPQQQVQQPPQQQVQQPPQQQVQQPPQQQVQQPAVPQQPNRAMQAVQRFQQPQQGMTITSVKPGELPPPAQAALPQIEQQPQWAKDLIDSQGNLTRLHAFVGNETYPEEQRKWAAGLLQKMYKDEADRDDANALIQRYAIGDPSAINTVNKELRSPRDKGSYFKAYLFNRLGLSELAREQQNLLMSQGVGKIAQASIDGKQYTVEYDPRTNAVVRAWNVRGTEVGEDTLAKISAGGQRPGAQVFGFTGEVGIVKDPSTGQDVEVRQRTNSQTGKIENVIVTGPNAGTLYTGAAIPQAKSVTTALAKAENDLVLALKRTFGNNQLKIENEYETIKGPFGSARNPITREQFRQIYQFDQALPAGAAVQTRPPATGGAVTAAVPGATVPQRPPVNAPAVPGRAVPAGTGTEPVGELQTQQALRRKAGEESIVTREQEVRTEQKPPAEARGQIVAKDINNQQAANSQYALIKPISDLIKQSTGSTLGAGVDKVAGLIGASPKGAQAIAELDVLAYSIVSNVPRFEGPQGVRDVELYERAAGDLANSSKPVKTRLAALNAIVTILKKYDKAGTNDWTFGQGKPSSPASTAPLGSKENPIKL